MRYSYQVLSTPTADTPGSTIVLQYEGRKYLFGHLAEGTQRTIIENGVAVGHLNQLFGTGKTTWANYGGMIGMILTLADSWTNSMTDPARKRSKNELSEGPQKLTIHGGKNINHILATARRFIFRKNVPLRIHEYDSANLARERDASQQTDVFEKPTWTDGNINVWAMSLKPSYEKPFERASGFKSPRKRSLNQFEERDDQVELDPKTKNQLLREHIVKDMFDSDWKMDALQEEYLPYVKMPATIFIRNPESKDIERYVGPLPGGDGPVPNIKVLVRRPWPAALVQTLPSTAPASESLCYFVRGQDQRGKFDVQKAKALGVPAGPAFSHLTSGKSYTTPNGDVVTPDMVLGPPRRAKTVAILDIPSEIYIDDLLARPEWQSPSLTNSLSSIYWILGPGVGEDARIVEFVSRMKHCDHIVSSVDYCPNNLRMVTAAKSTLRLARINPDNFPVPVHDNVMLPQSGSRFDGAKSTPDSKQELPWTPARPGLLLEMEPQYGVNKDAAMPVLDTAEILHRIPKAVQQRLVTIQKRLKKPAVIDKILAMREELPPLALESEVITLGTGSSSPSKYRNVSATLLNVPGKGYYLFDCGENTLGQLKRVYGPEKLREVMENLRVIWISHLHADHHLGAVSVIKEWYEVNYGLGNSGSSEVQTDMAKILKEKRLCVIGECLFVQWLEEYAGVENFGFHKLLPLSPLPSDEKFMSTFIYRHMQADGSAASEHIKKTILRFNDPSSNQSLLLRTLTGLKDVRAIFVNHCRGSMAVTLEWNQGFKVSYSGDCRPSKLFTECGKNSTLLIHEATFQDDLKGQAVAKKHSTAAEAIGVGHFMNAKMLLLTHFSQRYAKISKFDTSKPLPELADNSVQESVETLDVPSENWPGNGGLEIDDLNIGDSMIKNPKNKARESPMPVCMAFDYMKVKIRDIPIAQMFSPAFEKLIERLEQAADEEAADLRQKELVAMQAKNPKKFGKGDKNKTVELPSRSVAAAERKHSAWSASESESGWSDDESDLGDDDSRTKDVAL